MLTQTCRNEWCKQPFQVTDEDLKFYEKVSPEFNEKKESIPTPTLCPSCRQQRRLCFRNERNLYHFNCALCNKSKLTLYSPEGPFTSFCHECWWGDQWNPEKYSREIDLKVPFFEQFRNLQLQVPRICLSNSNNQNCEFVNFTEESKDCYLVYGVYHSEKCCYGWRVHESLSCFDCTQVTNSQFCFDCIDSDRGYELMHAQNCENCSHSSYLFNCKSCSNCLFCTNLANKQFCIFNEQLSEDEYLKQKETLLGDLSSAQETYAYLLAKTPRKALNNLLCENSSGDYLRSCKNCSDCYTIENGQDCAYVFLGKDVKDTMDCEVAGWPGELGYECISTCLNSHMNQFCNFCWTCSDIQYCDSCFYSHHLFGCVGLRKKSFCIFNNQYSKEEYEILVPKLIAHMRVMKEWGEFFPIALSPFAYNESVAIEYMAPLSKTETEKRGWNWQDIVHDVSLEGSVAADSLPRSIKDVNESILKSPIRCEQTGRPFRIIKQELDFYRQMDIPLPRLHPNERHRLRLERRNPRKLWDRQCLKCNSEIQTSYSPDRPEIVYCERCYLETVY